jgi:hypothetical protein
MTTELERYNDTTRDLAPATVTDPTGGRLVAWAQGLQAAHQIGSALCRTSFVPKVFQGKPEEAAAAILFGDEIGLTPTQALRSVHVISGTPGLYSRAMVALVQSNGHEVWTELDTPAKVIVRGRRKGSSRVEESEWTYDRARKAGYTSNKKYETDPQAMLYARASADVCRKIAADVLAGVAYTVEEMELEEQATVTVKRETTPTARRTAKRAEPKPEPRQAEEPEFDEPEVEEQPRQSAYSAAGNRPAGDDLAATAKQIGEVGRLCTELGLTDRDEAVRVVSSLIGRPIKSRTELTKAEGHIVIDALQADLDAREQPADEPTFDEPLPDQP